MKIGFLVIGVLVAAPAFGQSQSTTNTTCTANGQQINCTSTTSTAADAAAQRAETQREINEAGANAGYALGTAIGAIKAKHDAKKAEAAAAAERSAAAERATGTIATSEIASDADKSRIMRCIQNPEEKVTNESGNIISCSVFMAKMKFFCAAAHKYAACEYLSTPPPHETPVGELSPIVKEAVEIGIKADITYCQKHPDSSVPQPSGPVLPCSEEIQQQQAFCKTSPGSLRCSQFGPPPEQTAKDNAASSAPKDQR
jgi:hypothetical protein